MRERRIKDIDDTFKALEEQKKLEAELKAQQAEMEKMQKIEEEQMKAAGGGGAPPPAPASRTGWRKVASVSPSAMAASVRENRPESR